MSTEALTSMMGMLQNVLAGLGMGPAPDPDTIRAIRAANHNNQRVFKAWDMYMTLIANGEQPNAAMRKVEDAMDDWQEYEDQKWIDPPIPDPPKLFPDPPALALPVGPEFFLVVGPPEPGIPAGHAKVVESAPGIMMLFEDSAKATEHARKLTVAHAKPYQAIAFGFQSHGPITVDAEFVDDEGVQ